MYDKNLVENLFKHQEFKKGLSYVEKFLRKEPENHEYLNDYGIFYSFAYDFRMGKKYIQKAVALKPDFYEAILTLTELYIKNNLPFSAIKVLENSNIKNYSDLQQKLVELKNNFIPEKVTFYIPVYNVEKYIDSCIKNILNQTYPLMEILIIDDASPDSSMKIVLKYKEKYPELIKIITHETNKGLAAVRNTAINNARGDYLATVDTDATPEDIFLETIMTNFKNKKNYAGIGGKLLEENSIYVTDRWREIHMAQHWGDKPCEPEFLYGSTSVYKIEALKDVKGFNEYYKTNYEDCDIAVRLKKKGYKLYYTPDSKAYHQRKDSLKSLINTYYNWVATPYKKQFNNFEILSKKGIDSFNILFKFIEDDIEYKRFQLLYPTFLSCVYWPLKDILDSEIDDNIKIDTLYGLAGIIFYSINQVKYITETLKNFLYEDLVNFLELFNLKKKIKPIAELDSNNPNDISTQILKLFPAANLKYISEIGGYFTKSLNLEPIIFKMIEVSRERIKYEDEYEKNFAQKTPRIMTINAPWRDFKRYGIRAGSRWPFTVEVPENNWQIPPSYIPYPFFLGYTTALLKENGFNVIMLDAIAEGLLDEEFFSRVKGFSPELILMETATASIYNDIDYVRKIKNILPDVKIILSGTHVSYFKKDFLIEYPCVDGIIIGEVEEAFLNISSYFKANKKFDGIKQKGFLYFNEKGEIDGSLERADLVDINKLPFPERLTTPVYNYEDLFAGMKFPSLQIHASRGCPYGCIYCVWPQVLYQSRSYRTRNPINVVDEIEEMVKFYGYRSFYFDDDTFNIGKERILKICEEIKKRGLDKIPWAAMARADTSDFETLKAMKEAGLISIKFGVESATQELVDACGKGLDLKKVEDAVKWCKELDLQFHLTFTFGLPGETKETIEKTIQYAMKLAPDTCQFSLTTPFPGTKHLKMAKEKGLLLTEEWDKYDGNRYTVMREENLSREELEEAVQDAYSRWEDFDRKRKGVKKQDISKCYKKPTICYNPDNLKIIFICQDGYDLAPARVRCYNFAKELNKLGMKSEVLSYYDNLDASDQGGPCENMMDIEKLQLNIKAYNILKKEKNAIFYVQKAGYHFIAPYLVAEENGNKIIFDYDDYDLMCHPFQNMHKFISSLNPDRLFSDVVKKSEACVGASNYLYELLKKENKNSYYIVTGVDADRFNFKENIKPINDTVEIIWMGHVWSPEIFNSLKFCIENYVTLHDNIIERSRLNLIMFGYFAEILEKIVKRDLPEYYNKKIIFHSKKHPDEIPEILYKSHIGLAPLDTSNEFVITFNKSKSPTKVFEYMASKVAVVGTKIGELEYVIEDGSSGFLYSNEPQEFKEKLSQLIMDDNLRNKFAQNAYNKVMEKYSLQAIGKQLLNVINSII